METKTIDVCVIATLRPEIIKVTLESFLNKVSYTGKFRFLINLDMVPYKNMFKMYDVYEMINIVLKEHQYEIFLGKGNFAKAVKESWKRTESEYVLHLEDDWEFIRNIDLDEVIRLMMGPNTYIRFPKIKAAQYKCLDKLALQPSLWCGLIVRYLSSLMNDNQDPEKQLRENDQNIKISNCVKRIIKKDLGRRGMVKDIGTKWREKNNISKWNKDTGKNITWAKDGIK